MNQAGQSRIPLRHRISWLTLLVFYLILIAFTVLIYWGKFSSNVDQLLHDAWVRAGQREAPQDVVIVGIDHTSLQQLGRWPWPRVLQTTLFNKLAKAGVQAVAVDLLYVEEEIDTSADVGLGVAMQGLPVVVMPVLTEGRGVVTEYLEKLPIPTLARHADELGHIFTPLDADGIVRRTNLKSGFHFAHWSTLGLALAQSIAKQEFIDLPGKRLPPPESATLWVEDYQVLIPFYGPGGTFTNIPAVDVISDTVDPEMLRDKIVFVGSTAVGLGDMLPTAVSGISKPMPGVEIHANIFASLRAGEIVTELNPAFNLLVAGVLLIVLLMFYSQLSPLGALVCLGMSALAPVVLSYLLYTFGNLWYAPLTASMPILVSYFVWSWHRLEFIAEFLRSETDKISADLPMQGTGDSKLLAQFFENTSRHLPLEGWQFSSDGEIFSGGVVPAFANVDASLERWVQEGDCYRRRYRTQGKLEIAIRASDTETALELVDYVDSLSGVRELQEKRKLSAPLERVQSRTYQLSQQLNRLRQLNVLSDSIFAGSSAGLIIWNASGEVINVNDLAKSMFAHTSLEQTSLLEFIKVVGRDPHNRDRLTFEGLMLANEAWQINLVDQDSELVINFSAVGETLTQRLVLASIVDVSEIRRSERSRTEMIDYLSHDIRSPLATAIYLLRDPQFPDDNERQAADIEQHINRSMAMMDDLLNIARADNLTTDQFRTVLFDEIIDNAMAQMLPVARAQNIQLLDESEVEEQWISCDASLLERAIVNILSNAIKYSPEHSTVIICTTLSGDRLELSVTDEGIGIAPEMMKVLFQRFKRDKAIAQDYKGIGLGLALVARVVTQHGGNVRADSPGKGTTITIDLPVDENLEQLD